MGKFFDYSPPASALDFSQGLSSVGDALTDVLNRRQKQREIDARLAMDKTQQAINLRKANEDTQRFQHQTHLDRLQAVNAIQGRLNEGDQAGAGAIAKAFGMDMQAGQPADVGPAPQAPVAPQPAMGVPPEIAARRRGRTQTSEDEAQTSYQSKGQPAGSYVGVDPLAPGGGVPQSITSREYDPVTQAARYQDTADMVREEAAAADQKRFDTEKQAFDQASASFPAEQRNYQAAKKRAEEERPFTLHMDPGDAGVTVEGRSQTARREEKAQQFLAAFDGVNLSPEEKEAVKTGYGSILAGEEPAKAMDAFRKQRAGLQGQAFKHGEDQFHEEQANARTALMARGMDPKSRYYQISGDEKLAAGNRQDRESFRRDMSDWESKIAGLPLDAKAYKRLEFVTRNINSDNALQQREAAEGLVGFFRGGVATAAAQNYLLSHLSGLGGRGETALEHIKSGKYGPQDLATLRDAATGAIQEQQDVVRRHYNAAQRMFGPGSGYENMGGQVNARVQGAFRDFGVDVPPLYQVEGLSAPLGSTDRPYKHRQKPQEKPGRPNGAPPEVKARDKGKAASALDEAMQ